MRASHMPTLRNATNRSFFAFAFAFAAALALALAAGCGGTSGGISGGGSLSCYSVVENGQECIFSRTSNASACPMETQEGSCPSAMLLGCCVTTLVTSEETQTMAVCAYSAAEETSEKATCAMDPLGKWQTTLPQ